MEPTTPRPNPDPIYDVVIVGAGLSGIGTAYWLQEKCPDKQYIILESRQNLGGTWDLFRYPGIRSDSDMFTFGYKFKPWKEPKSLSDGESILDYLTETVQENGIDQHIRFGQRVIKADWSSYEVCWHVQVKRKHKTHNYRSRFLYMCSGYYNYQEAHRPTFIGEKEFKGRIIHPQFWPQGLDYSGKKILVIGSGATAVTLVPAMTDKSAHVTMVQRSPTYIMNLPNRDGLFLWLKKVLPDSWAFKITRRKNIFLNMLIYWMSRAFPGTIRKLIKKGAASQLPKGFDVDKHFNPSYDPWDQRLCVVPDGDLFTAINEGKASVVTDEIDRFTIKGIRLQSGIELDADIIVLATGLKIQIMGGASLMVDGKKVEPHESMIYKGMMISDVPNFAIAFGYTNAPWTLKTDLTANYICKLLNYMDKKGYQTVVPAREEVDHIPFLNINSGYIKRAQSILPKQGHRRPWRVYQNYFMDMLTTRFGRIEDDVLKFNTKMHQDEVAK